MNALNLIKITILFPFPCKVWLAKNEIIVSEKRLPSYSRRSNQWWLCSLIVGLLRDFNEIRQGFIAGHFGIIKMICPDYLRSILSKAKPPCDLQGVSEILCRNKGVFCDLGRNSMDILNFWV